MKNLLRLLLRLLYRVELRGVENYTAAGPRVLIVANHTSFLDAALLAAFLPGRLTFAVNSHIAQRWWMRLIRGVVEIFPMDPTSPLAIKSLVKVLKEDRQAVIFPEGRITVTGALMKVYQGPGLIADRAQAMVLPVRIDGAQYTPFSRLRGIVRLRWLPRISLTVLPPLRLTVPPEVRGRARRAQAGRLLSEVMAQMIFATSGYQRTLIDALWDARRTHGGGHLVAEDVERRAVSYDGLIARAWLLGRLVTPGTAVGERVGVLLPSMVGTLATFLGLLLRGRVPAMLNYTVGVQGMVSGLATAGIQRVITSRRFVSAAKLQAVLERLAEHAQIVYLDDLTARISAWDRLQALLVTPFAGWLYRHGHPQRHPDDPAVVLFTSGSEGLPKGVVLSHANLLANREQVAARIDFTPQDIILNALPVFHSFGLTAGTLLPLMAGMRVFFYPSPLHYRIIPEIAYDINATLLFGTNTFLAGYAKHAHPYDFYSVRYVFAGAERLQEETRRAWAEKFGLRIFEGYGATETSPVLTNNTAMACKDGTVGRFLPAIEHRLEDVPGISEGGRLHVRGPNIMLGYLLPGGDGTLVPPRSCYGSGWYDTGDIVSVDDEGFVTIRGRVKRFAKVGGEMVSLTAVEALAERAWPELQHAAVALPDSAKGEQLVLVTSHRTPQRAALLARAKQDGLSEINVPRRLLPVAALPVLGTGKIDYPAVRLLAEQAYSHVQETEE